MKLLKPFLFIPLFYLDGLAFAETGTVPIMSMELAIEQAKYYAADNGIDLSGKFMKKTEYHNNPQDGDGRPYWQVYWINRRVTKGGGVELRLFADGRVEEKYYK